MKRISLVINVDTRDGWDSTTSTQTKMFDGTRSADFIIDGVENKIKAVSKEGFEIETTLFIDVHNPLSQEMITILNNWLIEGKLSNLVLNKHKKYYDRSDYFPKFNDINYLNALMLARGEYVVHFDGDTNAFIKDKSVWDKWIKLLDDGTYDYISYPSAYSPAPIVDPDFPDYWWASTRFFITKKRTLDYSEILKCLMDSEYLYGKYGDKKRRCPWIEHILGIIAGKGKVFYPPLDINNYLIFSWSHYQKGVLANLNKSNFETVSAFIITNGGISYPCDVGIRG